MIRSKTTFKQGYFETRVKMPRGVGSWPAFWYLPETPGWPPEVDIFEFVNNGVDDKINMLHTGVIDRGAQAATFMSPSELQHAVDVLDRAVRLPDDFHVIGAVWDGDTETEYVDGQRIVQRGYKWVHEDGSDAGHAHLIFNLAIGGNWAGRYGVDNAAFPQALEIDYVRVYQKTGAHAGLRSQRARPVPDKRHELLSVATRLCVWVAVRRSSQSMSEVRRSSPDR